MDNSKDFNEVANSQQVELDKLDKIRKLMDERLEMLSPDVLPKDKYQIQIMMDGYLDIICTVSNLIKVSILALESGNDFNSRSITDPHVNVGNVLELALQFLPIEGGEFLDEINSLLKK